jgi:hypothetical protein
MRMSLNGVGAMQYAARRQDDRVHSVLTKAEAPATAPNRLHRSR